MSDHLLNLVLAQVEAVAAQGTGQLRGGSLGRANQCDQDWESQGQRDSLGQRRRRGGRWASLLTLLPLLLMSVRLGVEVDDLTSQVSAVQELLPRQVGE
jgi:hypothetical protein